MAEFAATALSLTVVRGDRRFVMSLIGEYLQQHHEPYPALPRAGRLFTVDVGTRTITSARRFDLSEDRLESESADMEYWRSASVELLFGKHLDFIKIHVRQAQHDQTYVELWFPTAVHECVFSFDSEEKDFDAEAKSDLMRLLIGLTKKLGAAGFAYRYSEEDSLFGPPTIELLRDYVEVGYRWHKHDRSVRLLVAGLAASCIKDGEFEYDVDERHPMHYRRSGYYICDRLWPR